MDLDEAAISTVECWHFLLDNGRMQYGGQQKVRVGVTYSIHGPIALCDRGFHGSRRALDALQYAAGALCCRVVIGGDIIEDTDKLVGHTRTVLWMADATRLLHEFACDIAEQCLEKHGVTDTRCHEAIRVKRLWLDGMASKNELATARAVAEYAAWNSTMAVVEAASRNTAWDSAKDVVKAASRNAAWEAVRDVSWTSAWAEAENAAWGTAWGTAWNGSWTAINTELESRLYALVAS